MRRNAGLALFFLISLLPLTAQETPKVTLNWELPEGEWTYRVLLYQNGVLLQSLDNVLPPLEIELTAGTYLYDLEILNKFGGIATAIRDNELKVEPVRPPLVHGISQIEFYEGHFSGNDIIYQVEELQDWGNIYLESNGETIPLELEKVMDQMICKIDANSLAAGSYDLIAFNNEENQSRYPGIIKVLPVRIPSIDSVIPEDIDLKDPTAQIQILGENLDQPWLVELFQADGTLLTIAQWQVIDTNEIQITLDLQDALAGQVNLQIESPWNEEYFFNRILRLNQSESRQDYYRATSLGTEILYGWSGAKYYYDAFLFEKDMELVFRNSFSENLPLSRYLGLELQGQYSDFEDSYAISALLGVYARSSFPIPLNLQAALLTGNVWLREEDQWSYSPILQAEASFLIQIRHFLLEAGGYSRRWLYPNYDIYSNHLFVRFGYRFTQKVE